jgi:hypothetical protein
MLPVTWLSKGAAIYARPAITFYLRAIGNDIRPGQVGRYFRVLEGSVWQ